MLASACGVTTGGVALGGIVTVVGLGSSSTGVLMLGGIPMSLVGAVLGGASAIAAKRFCTALVDQAGMPVATAMELYFPR